MIRPDPSNTGCTIKAGLSTTDNIRMRNRHGSGWCSSGSVHPFCISGSWHENIK